MRILIVEDELTNIKILQSILAQYGDVDLAYNGNEAIDLFASSLKKEQPYDLVCLDIMMPQVSGQEVLLTIRDLEKKSKNRRIQKSKGYYDNCA